jgi:type I restriction enzyme R subunit
MAALNEDSYEQEILFWLEGLGWSVYSGPEISPESENPLRDNYRDVLISSFLSEALTRLNPGISTFATNRIMQQLQTPGDTDAIRANQVVTGWLIDGVSITERLPNGEDETRLYKLFDFERPENNHFAAINQLTVEVASGSGARRPDIVLYVNGIPLVVLELKNPADAEADIWQAFNQLQTYKEQIPKLFYYNTFLVIADGIDARVGSLTSNRERFNVWRSTDGEDLDPYGPFGKTRSLVEGLLNKSTLIRTLRYFIVFEYGKSLSKLVPGYHQYFAVEKAFSRAVAASSEGGDRRGGVMWHTQGSGKSYEMACFAGMLATSLILENPTIIVVTDRKDLDHQLYDTFVDARNLLRQEPLQADSRESLREMLEERSSGGVIFTTIQKFSPTDTEVNFPALTLRNNVFVITDEAHRSQYGFEAEITEGDKFKVGYAQHMRDGLPNATFIAFTGTPIASVDRNTVQVFGDIIDVYDMVQANEDGATVPIYYENRQVPLSLPQVAKEEINLLAESLVEDEEDSIQAGLKRRWAELEQIAGAKPRLELIARDIVEHFENRSRSPELENGKAMVIGMSRNICVDLYNEIVSIRPEWHSNDHRLGAIKIVFHASASENEKIRPHVYTQPQKRDLENRFKDPADPLKLVIVRDMWLTGFSSSPCHTLYVDKPMKGHSLMQAIARVNRVFKDKPGGLVVDYIGIANELKEAVADYTRAKPKSASVEFVDQALSVFMEKLQILRDFIHEVSLTGLSDRPHEVIGRIANFVYGAEDGVRRFSDASTALSRAYALVNSLPQAITHREEVAVYQATRVLLTKSAQTDKRLRDEEREALIRQAVSRGIVPEGIVDVFSVAGLTRPNIGLLSEEFLREIRGMKEKNLAAEALGRLLTQDIKARFKRNVVQKHIFTDLLDVALGRYRNRSIETAQLIEELIAIAEKLNQKVLHGNADGLTDYEVAFYDALEVNQAAVREMRHDDLVALARELTQKVRNNIKIDWSIRESTQAALRSMVRDLLDRYGYPPDFSREAIETVIQQAESLTEEWLSA